MRRLLLIQIVLCLLLGSCFLGSSLLFEEPDNKSLPNLVGNPGFETTDARNTVLPAGWLLVSNSTDKSEPVSMDSTEFVTGYKSLKITNNTRDLLIVSDAFKIHYTGGYFIRCSVKSSKLLDKALKVHFWTYNAAGVSKNKFSKSIKPKTEWKKATISAGFLSNSVAFGRIAIFIPKNTDNTIWLDDIGCFQVYQFTRE